MDIKNMEKVHIMTHPLIKHKITMLRMDTTVTNDFRSLVEEITILMGYEALSDLKTTEMEIKTPIEDTVQPVIDGKKLAIVPILRAGLGMVNGMMELVPLAKIGHIGMYSDEETHVPHAYYCKLPPMNDRRLIVVVDPMLATGGSAIDSINVIKNAGAQNIKFACLISAPEGVENLHNTHPDIPIYTASLDRELNDVGYVLPGLGDAGDRIFGTL